jgi:hypothetical protein
LVLPFYFRSPDGGFPIGQEELAQGSLHAIPYSEAILGSEVFFIAVYKSRLRLEGSSATGTVLKLRPSAALVITRMTL